MISRAELEGIASARLADAEVLHASSRFESASYLCGYAVELQLKAAICRTLGWAGFPSSSREFESFRSFRTHDLDVLLSLTGREAEVLKDYTHEWEEVRSWNPETRYTPLGVVNEAKTNSMLRAAATLLRVL